MASEKAIYAHREAERVVADLFTRIGYSVTLNVLYDRYEVDMVIEKDGIVDPVEVKLRGPSTKLSLSELEFLAFRMLSLRSIRPDFVSPLIVIVGDTSEAVRNWAENQFKVRVWDAQTLLQKAAPYPDLSQRLSLLIGKEASPAEDVSAQPTSSEDVGARDARDRAEDLIQLLEEHEERGRLTPTEYETLCLRVMIFLFEPDLYGFERQQKTSDGANRYDFICRIKPGNSFWDSIRSDFRTRSILFECKNYDDPITADQVYSTERYLFTGALRTVCLLMSRKGPDDGCARAAQGALRESGKLILLLSNANMVEMLRLKPEPDGPTSFLDQRLWKLTTTLPR